MINQTMLFGLRIIDNRKRQTAARNLPGKRTSLNDFNVWPFSTHMGEIQGKTGLFQLRC